MLSIASFGVFTDKDAQLDGIDDVMRLYYGADWAKKPLPAELVGAGWFGTAAHMDPLVYKDPANQQPLSEKQLAHVDTFAAGSTLHDWITFVGNFAPSVAGADRIVPSAASVTEAKVRISLLSDKSSRTAGYATTLAKAADKARAGGAKSQFEIDLAYKPPPVPGMLLNDMIQEMVGPLAKRKSVREYEQQLGKLIDTLFK